MMIDVSQLHDDELIKMAGIHSSELSDGYLQHLDQKLNPPPPPPEPPKPEPPPPPPPEPPVVNVSVESDPAIAAVMVELRDLLSATNSCVVNVIRDENGDIAQFVVTEK